VLAASLCLFALSDIAAQGSAKKTVLLPPRSPNTPQGLEGGFWRTDNNFDPILHLKNVLLKLGLVVTPEIFFADGTEYKLPVVHLEPAGVASVDLKIAIQNVPPKMLSHVSSFGMVAISYNWSWPAIMASLQNTDEIASLSGASSPLGETSVVHRMPEAGSLQLIRGTWWRPSQGSDEVIALGNTSLSSKQVQLQLSDSIGTLLQMKELTLASHSTTLLRLSELLPGVNNPGYVGDVTIRYSGAPHAIVASASIEDETTGFSVAPHMVEQRPDPDEAVHSITLDAPGLMFGKPDPAMLFPVDTVFTPFAIFHNVSNHPITAALSLTSDGADGSPVTRPLETIVLASGATIKVDMNRYFNSKMPLPRGYGHLSASFNGRYGELILDAGSVDQTQNYVFQVATSAEVPTTSKNLCYWSVEGDTSTMISIWNYANLEQNATLVLYYHGGQYRIPIHLGPRETYNLDMMALVRSRAPDPGGNLIPDYISNGSAMLVGPRGELDKMTVVVSASTYNVRNATCYPICLNCGGVVSVSVPNYSVIVGGTVEATATLVTASGTEYENSGDWTSNNSSIATVNSSGTVTGVAGGSTGINFTVYAPPGDYECYQQGEEVCPYQFWGGTGLTTVQVPTGNRTVTTPTDAVPSPSNGAATDCPSGQAGWNRVVGKMVTDQSGTNIVVQNQYITETYTIGTPNNFGITSVGTGQGYTYADGSFGDRFRLCSKLCPGSSGQTDGTQHISDLWNGHTYTLTSNAIVWKCSSITINGQ
jgi:hypothetical protein